MRNYRQNSRRYLSEARRNQPRILFSSFIDGADELEELYKECMDDSYDADVDENTKYEVVMDKFWSFDWEDEIEPMLRQRLEGLRCVIKEEGRNRDEYYIVDNGYDCLTDYPISECSELEVADEGNCLYVHGEEYTDGYNVTKRVRKLTTIGNDIYEDYSSNGYYSYTKRDPKIYELDEDEFAEKLYNSTHYSTNPMKN